MATYQDAAKLTRITHEAFDKLHKPGETTPFSGIYVCTNCGDEIAANKGNPLPPQNHKQHTSTAEIRWKLLVYAETK